MRKQLSKIIFILIISLFIHPLIGYSKTYLELTEELTKSRREPLKGIKGIRVSIELLNPVAKELGITEESLKTEVELKLRLAGIKVYSTEEWLKSNETISILYINLNTIREINIYAFNIIIELQEDVYIKRINQGRLSTIWEWGYLGLTQKGGSSFIWESLKKGLDRFLNDYLAVNPKK